MDLFNNKQSNLLRDSIKAECGLQEREITVKSENVSAIKKRLKEQGYFIVGTSESGRKFRKVWFSPGVSL